MIKRKKIPDDLWKKILPNLPIATVDFVIVRGRGKGKEFLLGKRVDKPYRGKWFIPGGRILWGESLENAVKRQLGRELGIIPKNFSFLFHYPLVNPPGEAGVRYFTILHVYQIPVDSAVSIKLNEENSQVRWFQRIGLKWPKPVRVVLEKAGFLYDRSQRRNQ